MPRLEPGTHVTHKHSKQLGVGKVVGGNINNVKNNDQDKAKAYWVMVDWEKYEYLTKPRAELIEDLTVVKKNQEGGRRRTRRRRSTRRSRSYRKK